MQSWSSARLRADIPVCLRDRRIYHNDLLPVLSVLCCLYAVLREATNARTFTLYICESQLGLYFNIGVYDVFIRSHQLVFLMSPKSFLFRLHLSMFEKVGHGLSRMRVADLPLMDELRELTINPHISSNQVRLRTACQESTR